MKGKIEARILDLNYMINSVNDDDPRKAIWQYAREELKNLIRFFSEK